MSNKEIFEMHFQTKLPEEEDDAATSIAVEDLIIY